MWQPDGWGWRARLGLLTPHADVGPECEFQAMAPEGVSIHAARVPLGIYAPGGTMAATIAHDPISAFGDPPLLDDAVELLAAAPLHAIAVGFTSMSYVRGAADDVALRARLQARTRGIPVVITCAAAADALASLCARTLALINPPWFSSELNDLGSIYFRDHGIDVVFRGSAELPSAQQAINPGQLFEWVRAHVPDTADAIFIGGNGLRAVGVIDALEQDLKRPVLTANQVAFWQALRLSGSHIPVTGYGRLFEHVPSNGGAAS